MTVKVMMVTMTMVVMVIVDGVARREEGDETRTRSAGASQTHRLRRPVAPSSSLYRCFYPGIGPRR